MFVKLNQNKKILTPKNIQFKLTSKEGVSEEQLKFRYLISKQMYHYLLCLSWVLFQKEILIIY